jgi:hypothetical protein
MCSLEVFCFEKKQKQKNKKDIFLDIMQRVLFEHYIMRRKENMSIQRFN